MGKLLPSVRGVFWVGGGGLPFRVRKGFSTRCGAGCASGGLVPPQCGMLLGMGGSGRCGATLEIQGLRTLLRVLCRVTSTLWSLNTVCWQGKVRKTLN